MENEIVQIKTTEMLTALNRTEIDMQIATAKQYPRDINKALDKILLLATLDEDTADECFYAVKRGDDTVEGVSVRLAEIIASCWGNLRIASRVVANDGRMITAQAVCHDLESNEAVSIEVQRSILTKKGFTYSNDMQVVTGNAACAIAFRNAVLRVIPKAITKRVTDSICKKSLTAITDLEAQKKKMFTYFDNAGVKTQQLFKYLGVKNATEISKEHIMVLRGLAIAIKEGTTSVAESFTMVAESDKLAEEAKQKSEAAAQKAAAAMGQNK